MLSTPTTIYRTKLNVSDYDKNVFGIENFTKREKSDLDKNEQRPVLRRTVTVLVLTSASPLKTVILSQGLYLVKNKGLNGLACY